jgi:hypothetical protein
MEILFILIVGGVILWALSAEADSAVRQVTRTTTPASERSANAGDIIIVLLVVVGILGLGGFTIGGGTFSLGTLVGALK